MSVTFSAIDANGDFVQGMDDYDVHATNHHAVQLTVMLGFRAPDDDDIPAGRQTVDEFTAALMSIALAGGGLGDYGNRLGMLCANAYLFGAVAIVWA